jgi:hypothetical protein
MTGAERLSDLHPIWREALACYEALRRLGFSPEDIFLSRHEDGRMMLLVRSARYGLIVNLAAGDAAELRDLPHDELTAEWARAAVLWNGASREETAEVYKNSLIYRRSDMMMFDLVNNGIAIPATCDA